MLKHKARLKKRSLKREINGIRVKINLIRNKIYLKRRPKNGFSSLNVRKEFRLNDFITLRLIDFGNTDMSYIHIYVNDMELSLDELPFKEIILSDSEKINYLCMDDARSHLIGLYNKINFKEDPDTEFWIYCYYINAWVECNYDWRLLTVDDAFTILNALYIAGDPKAREVFKIEIAKALLSGYLPAVFYLTSPNKYYLDYFEFEEVIWLFETCIKIIGFHKGSELKTHLFYFLRKKGIQYLDSHNFKKSIKCLNKMLKLYPFDIETLNQLSKVYLKNGDYQLAKALLIYIIDLSSAEIPSSDDFYNKEYNNKPYTVEAWCNLGEVNNRLLLFSEAIIPARMAMYLDPNHINTWDQIAIAYEGMGYFKNAKKAKKSSKKKEKEIMKNQRKVQWH